MSVVELDRVGRSTENEHSNSTGLNALATVRRTEIVAAYAPIDLSRSSRPGIPEGVIPDGGVGIQVSTANVQESPISRLDDLLKWGAIYPAIVTAYKEGNGELEEFISGDRLLNFIKQRWGSSPVIELVYSKGEILNVDPNTEYGQAVSDLFKVDSESNSLVGFKSPYESILAGLEITEGVRERLHMFRDQTELMLLHHMLLRMSNGSREAITGIDFGAGSMRYVSEALQSIFSKYPYLRNIFGEGEAQIDDELLALYPELKTSFAESNQKIPLKFYGVDADPVATRYCAALAKELGVAEFIEPVHGEFRNLVDIDSFFKFNDANLGNDDLFDIITSSGLDDYYKLSRRSKWFAQLYHKLKPGLGISYIASIADFPEMVDTNGNGLKCTEPMLLSTFFDWGNMYADTPGSAIGQYMSAGWKPGEIKFVEKSPNGRFFAVVTQRSSA